MVPNSEEKLLKNQITHRSVDEKTPVDLRTASTVRSVSKLKLCLIHTINHFSTKSNLLWYF
jgi:hypothetical protein